MDEAFYTLVGIFALGISAQWVAARFRLPSILLLLICGFIAGPITGWLDPDLFFGDLLFPIVTLSVAIILYEGGLTLRLNELKKTATVIRNLITFGALSHWALITFAAYVFLKISLSMSILLGAMLIVTGPTVIGPLLRQVRLNQKVSSVLKWESIIIDPIGAILAVLVTEEILIAGFEEGGLLPFLALIKTLLIGGGVGALSAWLMILVIKKQWVPDPVQNAVSLLFVILVITVANFFQPESGLLAITLFGIILTNQKAIAIRHIIEFKENIRLLLLAFLFILLAARLPDSSLTNLSWGSLWFVLFLLFVARPISVFLATIASELNWKERLYIGWIAPRGIIAAAISSLFALRLSEAGFVDASILSSTTFLVIVVTVVVHGLTAQPLAKWLGISGSDVEGVLVLGAHWWARKLAKMLQQEGVPVLVVDSNRANIRSGSLEGLSTLHANILSDEVSVVGDKFSGMGRLLALTSNDEVNALACLKFADHFERSNVFQLAENRVEESREGKGVSKEWRGRALFEEDVSFKSLEDLFSRGALLHSFKITKQRDFNSYMEEYSNKILPLFVIDEQKNALIFTKNNLPKAKEGQVLIALLHDNSQVK